MNRIPPKLKAELAADPEYKLCVLGDTFPDGMNCSGRITWEHAILYAGKQVQERWAIIPLCVYHHLGNGLNKRWNKQYAMSRATEEDKKKYPRLNWEPLIEKYRARNLEVC